MLTAPYLRLYTFINHENMCIKSEVEEILFKLTTNDHSDEAFLLTSNIGPNGLSAPAQGLCLNFFSSITADFNISSALRWAIQNQLSSGFETCLIDSPDGLVVLAQKWFVDKYGRQQPTLILTFSTSPLKQLEEFCRNFVYEFLSMSRWVRPKTILVLQQIWPNGSHL